MRLQSIFSLGEDDAESEDSFEVLIYRNGDYEPFADARQQDLSDLLQNRAVFHIEGRFDASAESFEFTIAGQSQAIELTDPTLTGMRIFRDTFGKSLARRVHQGPFRCTLYLFDFVPTAEAKYQLNHR